MWASYLPAIGRFLIVVTFLEDALRIVTQWSDQLSYLNEHRHSAPPPSVPAESPSALRRLLANIDCLPALQSPGESPISSWLRTLSLCSAAL